MHSYILSLIAVLSLNVHATVEPDQASSAAPAIEVAAPAALIDPRIEILCGNMLANAATAGEPIKADEVTELFGKIGSRVTDILGNSKAAPWTRERAEPSPTIEKAKDVAADTVDKAQEVAGQVASTVSEVAGQAAEKVDEITAPARDAAADIAHKATDTATEVAVHVADEAQDAAEATAETAKDTPVADAAKADAPVVTEPTSTISVITDLPADDAKAADAAAKVDSTVDAAKDVAADATAKVESGVDKAKDAAADATEKTADAAAKPKGLVGKGLDQVKESASKAGQTVASTTKNTTYSARERASELYADIRQGFISDKKPIIINVLDKNDPDHGLNKSAARAQVDALRYVRERIKDVTTDLGANEVSYIVSRRLTGVDAIKSYIDAVVDSARSADAELTAEFAALDSKESVVEKVVEDNAAAVETAKAATGWRQRFVERVKRSFGSVSQSRPSQLAARYSTGLLSVGLGAGVFAASHYTGQTETTTWVATVSAAGLPFLIFNQKIQNAATKSFTVVKTFVRERILGLPAIKSATQWTGATVNNATAWTSKRFENGKTWASHRAAGLRNWNESRRAVEVVRATEQIKTLLSMKEQLSDDPLKSRFIYNSFVSLVPISTETTIDLADPVQMGELIMQGLRDKKAGKPVRMQSMRIETYTFRGAHTAEMVLLGSKLQKSKPVPNDVMVGTAVVP